MQSNPIIKAGVPPPMVVNHYWMVENGGNVWNPKG